MRTGGQRNEDYFGIVNQRVNEIGFAVTRQSNGILKMFRHLGTRKDIPKVAIRPSVIWTTCTVSIHKALEHFLRLLVGQVMFGYLRTQFTKTNKVQG